MPRPTVLRMAFEPDKEPENASPEHLLNEWLRGMPPVLIRLRDVYLGEDFPFDFSPESLDHLEARLLEHYGADDVPEPEVEESVTAYLGEVLMRTAGGTWGWHTGGAGRPVACPDATLGRKPVAPQLLLSHALRARTGREFGDAHERLREAVVSRQATEPEWAPVKAYTPGVDPEPVETPD